VTWVALVGFPRLVDLGEAEGQHAAALAGGDRLLGSPAEPPAEPSREPRRAGHTWSPGAPGQLPVHQHQP